MRKKLVTAVAVGALGLSGAAIAGTALAATPSPTNGTAASPLDRIKQALSGLVSDKTLTQEQADKVASTLSAAGVGRGPGMPGMREHRGGRRGADLAAAAKALGMTEADLRTALMSGKSLAAIAKDKGVSVETLVAALVTAEKAEIAQAVKDGRLTQAEADARVKDLQARITERVNSTPRQRGAGGFGRHGRGPGEAGPGQAGPGQAGPGQAGPGQAGPGQTGPGQAGPGQPGPENGPGTAPSTSGSSAA